MRFGTIMILKRTGGRAEREGVKSKGEQDCWGDLPEQGGGRTRTSCPPKKVHHAASLRSGWPEFK